jgi:hypothetical protein
MFIAAAAGFVADYFVKKGSRVLVVRNTLQLVGMIVPAVCLAYCAYTPTLTATTVSESEGFICISYCLPDIHVFFLDVAKRCI